ncbi:MAG: SDR family oxidoreductase [Pseudomonadota bacterium]
MPSMLITGGSAGIGAATARLAARDGYDVGLTYNSDRRSAEALVAEIEAQGPRAVAIQADICSAEACDAMFAAHVSALGTPTVALLNAGIVPPRTRPLAEATPAEITDVITTNTTGMLFSARAAIRRMGTDYGGKGGVLILMSSVAARVGNPGEFVDYAASKAAVDAMVIGLSKELGPQGIRVCGIRPGLIDTDIHAKGGAPDRAARLGGATPLGRAGHADEVAEAVMFLASERSSYTTGTWLDIAGGR